ncbi:MAG: regulatory protein RecX, partial [Candidatus Methylomirabilales bacterium]
ELKERLLKRGFSPGDVAEALVELEKKGYLDDRQFAVSWARWRLSGKPMGRARLWQELKAKGLQDEDIEEALKETYAEADELKLALIASERKLQSLKKLDPEKRRQKLFQFLKRRGFPLPTIRKALGEKGSGETPPEWDVEVEEGCVDVKALRSAGYS